MQLNSPLAPFVVIFTTVEIATGIFDFAVSAQSIYPFTSDTSKLPWWAIVENWLTPSSSYNKLGTICWLANTAYPISHCLELHEYIVNGLLPLAVLYAWHECA